MSAHASIALERRRCGADAVVRASWTSRRAHGAASSRAEGRLVRSRTAAGRASADVEPDVLRLGDVEREVIVLGVAPADEHLETVDDERAVR